MASARGDALDWALALARAPGERHALRQRPLPDGMDVVLQVAAGHAAAIEDAAAHAGEPAAEVVEAARFYLREMLFFPDADAYRVLGLAADASDEQIKHHHRLLQQWLHPDRPTSDWDAAFAARVNAAWSQLRTPAKREAYAATLAAASSVPPAATDPAPSWSPPARIHAHAPDAGYAQPDLDEGRWRRRAPVLALFGVCAVLGVLAVRDTQREPETGLTGTKVAGVEVAEQAPAVALQLPAATLPSNAVARSAPSKRVTPAPVPAPAPAPAPAPRAAPVAPVAVAAKPTPQPAAEAVVTPGPRPAAPRAAVAVASKPVPKPLPTPIAKPITRPLAPLDAIAAAPKSKAVAAKPVAASAVPSPTRKPPVGVAAATPSVAATAPKASSATPKGATVLAAAPLKPAVKSAVKPASAAEPPVATVAKPMPQPPIKPAPLAPPAPEPTPPVAAAPVIVATAATPAAAPNSPTRVAQAQQTGQRLLAYVAGRGAGVPPIWANVASQKQASRAREVLQGGGRVDVGSPDWRVGGDSAAMQASLTQRDGSAHRLRLDLVWREQRWLVAGLTLEQAP